ncbi:MAG: DUF2341 domain-containing protein [Akkermansiaceae bacterium]|nr:DUF2341 domain-containing protein [Akkermansiaceae bacterium]
MKNHLIKPLSLFVSLLALWPMGAAAQYPGWQHSGSMFILTTPEGADLPESAAVKDFPLLVRLNKEAFDFTQTKAGGQDIRFSADGKPLAYQIEEWDAAAGEASIWVRIPLIKGNARQEIKMHWGKADAASESKGEAVFNESNGYLCVMHLSDPENPVKDEVGSISPTNSGAIAADGMIGRAMRFNVQKGVNCGETITTLPTDASDHTSEAWIKAEGSNAIALAWGNEYWVGKVTMRVASPPHIGMECYFSGADVKSGKIPMSQWIHVVHAYKKGDSRIYVNGKLDGTSITESGPLDIKSPARMYLGGWHGDYQFKGDIDEVRLSKVTRSADWVKMEYENQNPLQTLAGSLVQPGSDFSVSQKTITVAESKSATVTAKAGGAQKVYWLLKENNTETVVGVDSFSYTFPARRVTGDQSLTLQFKAVYADGVKTKDIAITIKETIPEPVFTLKAPTQWDGRSTIEVLPQIKNLAAMQAANAGDLKFEWSAEPFAVTKEVAPGKLRLLRAQNSGKLTVSATVSNGGKPVTQNVDIMVTEPKSDPWLARTPGKDEKPEDGQFYARDDKGLGTLYYNGTLTDAADAVFLKLYADDKLIKTETAKPAADKSYALSTQLKPGLIQYKVEFGTKTGGKETVHQTVNDLVCGDAYIIDGQSNALATDTAEESPPETNQWIRSYGRPSGNKPAAAVNLWCYPVWKAQKGEKAELGWWGMELAKRLVESQKVPIFILNAAAGGTRIDQHLPNPQNRRDTSGDNPWTNPYKLYGSLLTRVEGAKLTHGIRGILWHQGENDQGSDGPTGGYGWQSYHELFKEMAASWKQDFPNVKNYYVFQIYPNACGMGSQCSGDRLREKQRTLPYLFSNMSILSTLGVQPPGGCHYPLVGWAEFARMVQPIIERDHYGLRPDMSITAPNLKRAVFANTARDTLTLEFDQPLIWFDQLASQFYLDGEPGHIASGSTRANTLTLKLKAPSTAKHITYLKETNWNQNTLLLGANGLAALTFCEVPLQSGAASR